MTGRREKNVSDWSNGASIIGIVNLLLTVLFIVMVHALGARAFTKSEPLNRVLFITLVALYLLGNISASTAAIGNRTPPPPVEHTLVTTGLLVVVISLSGAILLRRNQYDPL